MPNLEVYRIGYTIKGQIPTETELDATNLGERRIKHYVSYD